ncbi:MAG TPA: hypothetical protein PKH31_01355 [Candidatus Sumerlaeota bacterium]|nr:hypothetical protein [Candidatus Sumerlaeota bacterium]
MPPKPPLPPFPAPPLYDDWIRFLFDRPVTRKKWYDEYEFEGFHAEPLELVRLLTATCRRCGTDLEPFSDGQVALGLNYLFIPTVSDVIDPLKNEAVPVADRIEAIESLLTLYTDCFARRCEDRMSHVDDGRRPLNDLNLRCYMLWDESGLDYWERVPGKERFYAAVAGVLEQVLRIDHTACIESALHGLGHIQMYAHNEVKFALKGWPNHHKRRFPDALYAYAREASLGQVQ